MLLKGRKTHNEAKFAEDSKSVINIVLPNLQNGGIHLADERNFTFLAALLVIVDLASLPPQENVFGVLVEASQKEVRIYLSMHENVEYVFMGLFMNEFFSSLRTFRPF